MAKAGEATKKRPTVAESRSRRRNQTRSRLIKAARVVMSQNGFAGASIAEIAAVAEVGFGSFYNHFDSKETIAREVFMEQTERLALIGKYLTEVIDDPAEAISLIGRVYIHLGHNDPMWGWFVINVDTSFKLMDGMMGDRGRRYLRKAVKSGRIKARDPALTIAVTLSTFITIIREMLEKRIDFAEANRAMELVLCMYGLTPQEAARIAALPLPPAVLAMLHDDMDD